MRELQRCMKKYCDTDNECNVIKLEVGTNNSGSNRYSHHEWMLPHWKELFKALRGRTSVTNVIIRRIHLSVSVLNIILPSLKTLPKLTRLTLDDTKLGDDGLQRLVSFLNHNSTLEDLKIHYHRWERINDLSIATSLSDAVRNHPTLKRFVLDYPTVFNGTDILHIILNGCVGLETLSISVEELGLEGVVHISNFIRSNHPLKDLDLTRNKITDGEALQLTSALCYNTHLKFLNLQHNAITLEGEKRLLGALFNPLSMDSIVQSNHTCIPHAWDISKLSIIAQRTMLEHMVYLINADMNISIQRKIRKKVVLALCGVDGSLFNLSHFNDLPLQLIPRVLELIQDHTIGREKVVRRMPNQLEKDALSRLFHTLRGWELPLLFEYLNRPSTKGRSGKRKRRKTRHVVEH